MHNFPVYLRVHGPTSNQHKPSLNKWTLLPVRQSSLRQAWFSIPGIIHGERGTFEEKATAGLSSLFSKMDSIS